jgi:hypothetical protein
MRRLRGLGVVAGMVLMAAGAVAQSMIGTEEAARRIKAYKGIVTQIPPKDYGSVLDLLQRTRDATDEPQAIDEFRDDDDLAVIETLVDMAALDDRGIRINATLILANVVDNTTLCALIDRLLAGNLSDNARYNLLQVVKVVASYARQENRAWIQAALEQTRVQIGNSESTARTSALVGEIAGVLDRGGPVDPATFAEKYPAEYAACVRLDHIEPLVPTPDTVPPAADGG